MTQAIDASSSRVRIAFVTPSNPIDADSGGKQFTLDRLIGLSELADVDVFCLNDTSEKIQRLTDRLSGRPVYCAGELKARTAGHWLVSLLRGLPLSVWRNDVLELRWLVERLRSKNYDLVYVDHWLMWPVAEFFDKKARRILNLHNAEHRIFERAASNSRGLKRFVLKIEADRVRRFLRRICTEAKTVHSISDEDKAELAGLGIPGERITTILPSVKLDVPISGRAYGRVLFAGTLSWAPNAEGLDWFLREVLPILDLDEPVQVVGGEPSDAWLDIASGGKVEFLGRVPSVDPLYANSSLMIAPVFSGSGIKMKIVNALARGLPVVTTTCGIEGFPPGWEVSVRVADSPKAYADAITGFLRDHEAWPDISRRARVYAMQHFSADMARLKLEKSLNDC